MRDELTEYLNSEEQTLSHKKVLSSVGGMEQLGRYLLSTNIVRVKRELNYFRLTTNMKL